MVFENIIDKEVNFFSDLRPFLSKNTKRDNMRRSYGIAFILFML